jgi:hypothetical protein
VFITNSGATSFSYGAGGSTQVSFNGFAGYDANRNGSMTDLSFTNKKYVDSLVFMPLADTSISTSYTLTSRDVGRSIYCTNTTSIDITIPTGLATGITNITDKRCNINIFQEGTGTGIVNFVIGGGMTADATNDGTALYQKNSSAEIKFKTATHVKIIGQLL